MIVACVRTGDKYGIKWVERLRNGVRRHLPLPHDFVCLTDDVASCKSAGIYSVDIGYNLPGWWGKMYLFEPKWREGRKIIYLDIDCVPIGPLGPLTKVDAPFAICDNFGRLAGKNWPCAYNSSVMVIHEKFGSSVWKRWNAWKTGIMSRASHYGDQKAIEELIPDAVLLQNVLPEAFMIDWRALNRNYVEKRPANCSIVVFAGNHKPNSTGVEWIKQEWEQ